LNPSRNIFVNFVSILVDEESFKRAIHKYTFKEGQLVKK